MTRLDPSQPLQSPTASSGDPPALAAAQDTVATDNDDTAATFLASLNIVAEMDPLFTGFASLDERVLNQLGAAAYAGCCVPIVRRRGQASNVEDDSMPYLTADRLVVTAENARFAIGSVDLDLTRAVQPKIFTQAIQWADHLGLMAVILPLLSADVAWDVYSKAVVDALATVKQATQIWVRVPLSDDELTSTDSWLRWHRIKQLCDNHPKLHVVVECNKRRPNSDTANVDIGRWLAEPVSMVTLGEDVWLQNAKGFPVLGKVNQSLVHTFMRHNIRTWMVSSTNALDHPKSATAYTDYLRHLAMTQPQPSVIDRFAAGYEDLLQSPLQPLMDNLDAGVYNVFMQDPVKYRLYEEAIYQELLQRKAASQEQGECVVIVVGAGSRGPLVSCVLRAARRADYYRHLRVYAVEKNPNAMVTLQQQLHVDPLWIEHARDYTGSPGDAIRVVFSDMRNQMLELEPAHIMVSELLGSFGDNELSPECIDGALSLLKRGDANGVGAGISIPQSSTAFVEPVSTSKLHRAVAARVSTDGYPDAFETPYVVHFKDVFKGIVEHPLPVWTFDHVVRTSDDFKGAGVQAPLAPASPSNKHNERCAQLRFAVLPKHPHHSAAIHGFAGYFTSDLHTNAAASTVRLSIHPESHSPDMTSWFPIFFPSRDVVTVTSGDVVAFTIWRCIDDAKGRVWYEWVFAVETSAGRLVYQGPVHNAGGRSYWIGL